ncbi:MAG TPA: tetratricopeptide repeat protein [Verrucomicrobiae bacterium]|nr:tetratricopeptide repeat protein [Verrucomicrobiae bacterium]
MKNPAAPERAGLFAAPEKRTPVVCLLLAVVTLALYNPVSRHPFVNYDDDRYITENPHVRQGLTVDTVMWALTSTEQANWHPLTWMSHALDCSLFRLNPAGHHFTSVLLHMVNVLLLFLLLRWATGRFGASLFVAALFAIHPINVESVAWVAERKNVLCTLFFLLTLWAYGWYSQKPDWKRYLAVVVLFAAGLASKPMVITLPFVLLLLDYWPLGRVGSAEGSAGLQPGSYSWSQLVLEKTPLLALSAASAVITVHAQRAGGAMRSTQQFSFGVRLANAICAYGMYLWKAIWPSQLAPLYPHPGSSLPAWRVAASAAVLIAITAMVIRLRSKRHLLVGWLWYLGTLVPVIGLVQVGDAAMADRYAYIPLIGIFVMISFGVADFAEHRNFGFTPAVPAAAVLLALAAVTHRQIGYWQSNNDLWSHTLAVTGNNFIAEDNLGGALILDGKESQAFPHFEAAAQINPRDPMSHSNLGAYFQTHNRMQEAIAEDRAAIDLTSDAGLLAQTYANMGAAHRAMGENGQAQQDFDRSLSLNPRQFNAWLGLGLLAREEGKLDEAVSDLSRSLELRPTAQGFFELGRTQAQSGRVTDAANAYQQALKISPAFPEAQHALDALERQRQ